MYAGLVENFVSHFFFKIFSRSDNFSGFQKNLNINSSGRFRISLGIIKEYLAGS